MHAAPRFRQPNVRASWAPFAAPALFFLTLNGAAYVLAPSLFEAHQARGSYTVANNYELTRVYSQSLQGYQEIVDRFPDSRYYGDARIGVANSLMGLGRRDEAIDLYETLLTELSRQAASDRYRLAILARLTVAFEEADNSEGFVKAYEALVQDYPDSEVTKRAKRYSDAIEAAAANAGPSGGSEFVGIDVANAVANQPFTMTVRVMPQVVQPGMFSVALNMSFINAIDVVSVKPATSGTSDYWGKRFFQLSISDQPIDVIFTLKAKTAGTYSLDLDLESNFTMIELGKTTTVEVADQ